jgi:hypothetical protein
MSNVVKFIGKKPMPLSGPYFAGRPLVESFPHHVTKRRRPGDEVIMHGKAYIVLEDGPDGAQ